MTSTTAFLILLFSISCFGAPTNVQVPQTIPYFASIQNTLLGNLQECGGTILSPTWVLTAAHCVGVNLLTSRVVVGKIGANETSDEIQIRSFDFYNVKIHPDYNELANDIALLKVDQPFEFNEFVQPLGFSKISCFAWDEPTPFSKWSLDEDVGMVVKSANITLVNFNVCYDEIKAIYGETITIGEDTHICVSGSDLPCILDAGTSLVQDNRLIGLLSWLSAACLRSEVPAIFINVGYHKEFIKQNVDDL